MNKYDILQIPNAENCQCRLANYFSTDAYDYLILWVFTPIPTQHLYVRFDGLQYINAPFIWKGANFRLATVEESSVLCRKVYPEQPDKRIEQMAKSMKAYLIDTAATQIQILAWSSSVTDTDTSIATE